MFSSITCYFQAPMLRNYLNSIFSVTSHWQATMLHNYLKSCILLCNKLLKSRQVYRYLIAWLHGSLYMSVISLLANNFARKFRRWYFLANIPVLPIPSIYPHEYSVEVLWSCTPLSMLEMIGNLELPDYQGPVLPAQSERNFRTHPPSHVYS